MKNILLTILSITIGYSLAYGQDLSVPDSILQELKEVVLIDDNAKEDSFVFKIVFPVNYDSTTTYPVVLCLSGGNQTESIVNYCYAAWFRSHYFKNYFTILPVNTSGKNLKDYSEFEVKALLRIVKSNFNVTDNNWIIAGTSNGGVATFNFISISPELFEGAIVMPGTIDSSIIVNAEWNHLKVILAYGEMDSQGWKDAIKETELKLESQGGSVESIILKGQGHILPIGFNINQVYDQYYKKIKIVCNKEYSVVGSFLEYKN